MHIRIATRSSKLALWQARYVADRLEEAGHTTGLLTMETTGDKVLDVSISKIGSKGVFTEELEHALRNNIADIAVHSAKEMPSRLPDDFELIAFTEREEVSDVLVSVRDVDPETENLLIGTSSTRRTALLKHYYPHLRTVNIRGNLQTRIRKMEEGHCDALMLAFAGVHRMGYDDLIRYHMPLHEFVPPVGQGSVTVEIHRHLEDAKKQAIIDAVNHQVTSVCLQCERSFLKTLEGGCSIPAFGYAVLQDDRIHMTAGIVSLDGKELIHRTGSDSLSNASRLGDQMARQILSAGGSEILKKIKSDK